MWEGCSCCKSKAVPVIDREERIVMCSHCGLVLGSYSIEEGVKLTKNDTVHSSSSIVTTKPNNSSSYDFFPSNLAIPENCGSDPVSTATTEPKNTCYYEFLPSSPGNSQKPGSICVSIADMSDRLGLDVIAKNHANKIFKKMEDQIQGKRRRRRDGLIAACIYIACRQTDTTRNIAEISSVADEAQPADISDGIESIAETLGIEITKLMHIKPADFTARFCRALKVDSKAVEAAHEAAESFSNKVDSSRSPVSIAAAVAYHTALDYYERKLLKGVIQASGVEESTIIETHRELYPYPSTIAPKESAKAKDSKNTRIQTISL